MTRDSDLYAERSHVVPRFRTDPDTGLPLLADSRAVLGVILNHLPLPHSIVEFGCGQKAGIIIRTLVLHHGIPAWAVRRGLILEHDLSEAALGQTDPRHRPGALTVSNPLSRRAPLDDPALVRLMRDAGLDASPAKGTIRAGPYRLHLRRIVQFVRARSHVFVVLTFWDHRRGRAAERVVDPTLDDRRLFPVDAIRRRLGAPSALVFTAPLMGRFRLDPSRLTGPQRADLARRLGDADALDQLSTTEHAALVRTITGASAGTLGDPATWTHVNNVHVGDDRALHRTLLAETGRGDALLTPTRRLLHARAAGNEAAVVALRSELAELADRLELRRVIHEDAERCERELAPLAEVANTIAYFHAARKLAAAISAGHDLAAMAADTKRLPDFHGLGVRLRRRIESAAALSRDEDGRIDARSLNPRYLDVVVETIRQMNRAGLAVWIDQVGNLHGLDDDGAPAPATADGQGPAIAHRLRGAIGMGSHLDTVEDAGKFDGRLGVFSGIEVAHLVLDLDQCFARRIRSRGNHRPLIVTAFVGEEPTFVGGGITAPGSAAVAGLADVAAIHNLRNAAGERFADRLGALLLRLREESQAGRIRLAHPLPADASPGELVASCPPPTAFFTPRFHERHIEQGPVLDRLGVPLAIADRVAGILQVEVTFSGTRAETAACDLIRRLPRLTPSPAPAAPRATAGRLAALAPRRPLATPDFGLLFTLSGRSDHGGTTPVPDRRDPAVAAARIAIRFLEAVAALDDATTPVVGEMTLRPGTSPRMVPAEATLALGIAGPVDRSTARTLESTVTNAIDQIVRDHPPRGGTGIEVRSVGPTTSISTSDTIRVSLDLRAGDAPALERLRRSVDREIARIEAAFGVTSTLQLQRASPPLEFRSPGPVLQLERSAGGSHNPRETELAADILRGTLLQLAVVLECLSDDGHPPADLLGHARSRWPAIWRRRAGRFVGGARHDACNLAEPTARATDRSPSTAAPP